MRASIMAVSFFGLVALGARARAAQDPLDAPKADAAHHKVELENDQVRVVRWRLAPHEKTALHDHPALVSVLLTDADLKLTGQDGKVTMVKARAGSAGWRGPTVHVAENVGDRPVEGVLVEPKGPGNASWTPPANDATKVTTHDRVEFENDRVRIVRYVYEKGESAPMHDHPAGVQIVLTDAHIRQTTPDGKTGEVSGKAGMVRYRPPLSHAIVNLGDRFEGLLVDLKGAPAR